MFQGLRVGPYMDRIIKLIKTGTDVIIHSTFETGASVAIPSALSSMKVKVIYDAVNQISQLLSLYVVDGKWVNFTFCDVLIIDVIQLNTSIKVLINMLRIAKESGVSVPTLVLVIPSAIFHPRKFPFKGIMESSTKASVEIVYEAGSTEFKYYDRYLLPGSQELMESTARIAIRLQKEMGEDVLIHAGSVQKGDILAGILKKLVPKVEVVRMTPSIASGNKRILISNYHGDCGSISTETVIVDTMIETNSFYDDDGRSQIRTSWIDANLALRRSNQSEWCYRMIPGYRFPRLIGTKLTDTSILNSVPLYHHVIELLNVGIDPKQMIPKENSTKLDELYQRMLSLGLIQMYRLPSSNDQKSGESTAALLVRTNNSTNHFSYRPTDIGRFAVKSSMGLRGSVTLHKWLADGNDPYIGLTLLSLIDSYGPNYLWFPRQQRMESSQEYNYSIKTHIEKSFSSVDVDSDSELSVIVKIWNNLVEDIGVERNIRADSIAYCRDHALFHKKIEQVRQSLLRGMQHLRSCGLSCEVKRFNENTEITRLSYYLGQTHPIMHRIGKQYQIDGVPAYIDDTCKVMPIQTDSELIVLSSTLITTSGGTQHRVDLTLKKTSFEQFVSTVDHIDAHESTSDICIGNPTTNDVKLTEMEPLVETGCGIPLTSVHSVPVSHVMRSQSTHSGSPEVATSYLKAALGLVSPTFHPIPYQVVDPRILHAQYMAHQQYMMYYQMKQDEHRMKQQKENITRHWMPTNSRVIVHRDISK
jgi:hypothetical protein